MGIITSFWVIAGPKILVRKIVICIGFGDDGMVNEQEADVKMAKTLCRLFIRKVREVKIA